MGYNYTCTDAQKAVPGFGTYFEVSGNYVTAKPAAIDSETGELSQEAIRWIKENISDIGTRYAEGYYSSNIYNIRYMPAGWTGPYYDEDSEPGYIVYHRLPFGYYYIASRAGSAVILDSTRPEVTIMDKSNPPSLEKTIIALTNADEEDHSQDILGPTSMTDGQYGGYIYPDAHSATVQMGDKVTYQAKITARKGAEGYIFYDIISESTTNVLEQMMVPDSVTVTDAEGTDLTGHCTIFAAPYGMTVTGDGYPDGGGAYYKVMAYDDLAGSSTHAIGRFFSPCTGESFGQYWQRKSLIIAFDEDYLQTITEDTEIFIRYQMLMTERTIVAYDNPYYNGSPGHGNPNAAFLKFGHDWNSYGYQLSDRTNVFSARIKVFKYEGSGDSSSSSGTRALNNVPFVLTREDGKFYKKDPVTQAVHWVDTQEEADILLSGEPYVNRGGWFAENGGNGFIIIDGLTNGTYTLTELEALPGFNLCEPVEIVINNKHHTYQELKKTVNVANKAGSLLPTTGGPGTGIYLLTGLLMCAAAAVLLADRRRRSA